MTIPGPGVSKVMAQGRIAEGKSNAFLPALLAGGALVAQPPIPRYEVKRAPFADRDRWQTGRPKPGPRQQDRIDFSVDTRRSQTETTARRLWDDDNL